MIQQIEAAVLSKQSSAVVKELSTWTEDQRAAARQPFAIFMLAHGMEGNFVRLLDPAARADSAEVKERRKKDNIKPVQKHRSSDYDYQLQYIAWLAAYGLGDQNFCSFFPKAPDYEAESAQIMADRRPPWLDQWIAGGTQYFKDEDDYRANHRYEIDPWFWARLFHLGLVKSEAVDGRWIANSFMRNLPACMENAEESTKHAIDHLTSSHSELYNLPQWEYELHRAKEWAPVLTWMAQQKYIDHEKYIECLIAAVHQPLNQTERNGCLLLAKALLSPEAKCQPQVIVKLQDHWRGLLGDSQASVAGFALDQMVILEKKGKLDLSTAVSQLQTIFQHKPKTHAVKAVKLLARGCDNVDARSDALDGLCVAITHSNKDVQAAALEVLVDKLQATDEEVLAKLADLQPTVVPTLRDPLLNLINQFTTNPSVVPQADVEQNVGASGLEELIAASNRLPPSLFEKFNIGEAISAAKHQQLANPGQWSVRDLQVLKNAQAITPIESVDELIEVTSQAVEQCECPDTPDRIIDAIVRLHDQRPEHFETRTDSLRSRACADIFARPQRGLVAGVLGNAFSSLVAAWLQEKSEDDDDEMRIPEIYPAGIFLQELSLRIWRGTAYPLLSTPTHHGGWIDPTVWVERLHHVQSESIELLEGDVVRSLLRVAPDGRAAAWKLAKRSKFKLSGRSLKLAQFVLDLETPNKQLAMDDSWSFNVWMAAIRARDPQVNLRDYVSDEEKAQLPAEIWTLPDVLLPADYVWKANKQRKQSGRRGLVEYSPLPTGDSEATDEPQSADLVEALLSQVVSSRRRRNADGGIYTAKLHHLDAYPAPPFIYPYLATHWPAHLIWYWAMATRALSRRIESGASVAERFDQFLLPLLESDCCLDLMAARALWIATASKDPNAKSTATEVWIAMIAEDRFDEQIAVVALLDVLKGEWLKLNRVADVFQEVTAVSPLHVFRVALVIEQFLRECSALPRDTVNLLAVLDECNQQLGRSIPEDVRNTLQTFKSGKAKSLAQSLLKRKDLATSDRTEAVMASLEARIQEATRHTASA